MGFGSLIDQDRLLEGLRSLCAKASPGQCHSFAEIARACDCDKDTIRLLQRQAIRRVRSIIGRSHMKQIEEILSTKIETDPKNEYLQ